MRNVMAETLEQLDRQIARLTAAGEKGSTDTEKRSGVNAAAALGEAAARLREIDRELEVAAGDKGHTAWGAHRPVGIYALRSSPDLVVVDAELDTPRVRALGGRDDFDRLGSLPLELHSDRDGTTVRRIGDVWSTRPAANPPTAQDCAVELAARQRKAVEPAARQRKAAAA